MQTLSESEINRIKEYIKEFKNTYSSIETKISKEKFESMLYKSSTKLDKHIKENEKIFIEVTKIAKNSLNEFLSIYETLKSDYLKDLSEIDPLYRKNIKNLFYNLSKINENIGLEFRDRKIEKFADHQIILNIKK